jgi:hypothetical protein
MLLSSCANRSGSGSRRADAEGLMQKEWTAYLGCWMLWPDSAGDDGIERGGQLAAGMLLW